MRIAVMADRPSMDARVSDEFESSPAMLVLETDDESLVCAVEGPDIEKYIETMVECDCEAVVCTPRIGQEAFEPIAKACITRYDGTGLPVMEALRGALYNRLQLVFEYDGGPGCNSGRVDCEEGGCGVEDE